MNTRIRPIDVTNKNNKIKDKEELLELLKGYKTILNQPIYDYFRSLIELDINFLNDYISNDERKLLSELELYNETAIYNIYHRTIKLFRQEEFQIGKVTIQDNNGILSIRSTDDHIRLFEFNHINNLFGNTIEKAKTTNIGSISMFKTDITFNLTARDIELLKEKLEKVKRVINPYGSYYHHGVNKGLSYNWEQNHRQEILEYKHFLENIYLSKELDTKQTKEIELTNYVHNALIKEFNLTNTNYDHEQLELENEDYRNVCVKSFDNLVLNKTLTKKTPNLIINDNTKFI